MNPSSHHNMYDQQLADKATMTNIKILVGCLICLTAGLIVAVTIIGA